MWFLLDANDIASLKFPFAQETKKTSRVMSTVSCSFSSRIIDATINSRLITAPPNLIAYRSILCCREHKYLGHRFFGMLLRFSRHQKINEICLRKHFLCGGRCCETQLSQRNHKAKAKPSEYRLMSCCFIFKSFWQFILRFIKVNIKLFVGLLPTFICHVHVSPSKGSPRANSSPG